MGTDLRDAHLKGAYLLSAHLEKANLCGAHLEDVDLYETHVTGAIADEATVWPSDFDWRAEGVEELGERAKVRHPNAHH
jgi:uncharacterized protein YjbI with pentapeptide repeats